MEDQQLEALMNDLESDHVERKASLADKEKICEAICAFANDLPNHKQPGVLFIGVNDNGTCANLTIDDKLLLTLRASLQWQYSSFPNNHAAKTQISRM